MKDRGSGFGHAKTILLGEHAVVHGRPALAAALDFGVRAEARPCDGPRVCIPAWDVDVRPDATSADDLVRAMGRLFDRPGSRPVDACVTADAAVPARVGMGSSAALSVAVVRALADLTGEDVDVDTVERRAGLAEEVFHGRASGIDAAVASRGGVLRFVRGASPRAVGYGVLPVVVALVEPRAPTRHMVERVRRRLEARPTEIEAMFDEIAALVDGAVSALEREDVAAVGALMNDNHAALARLDVSTPRLDAACGAAREAGAVGAKLTGAGGGGCIIALAPGRSEAVAAALRRNARWVQTATLGKEVT